ncbi:MAG: hypothetical protein NTW49_09375 [Bacteroidia bacterium]|nr:hypothetical protein [Bacteroidia bacterium]
MNLFNAIRSKLGRIILKSKMAGQTREKSTFNLSSARTCGVIFDATVHENYDKALKFIAYLSERGIEVDAVAYVHKRDLQPFFLPHKNIDYFSKKNISLLGIPNNPYIGDFIKKNFDLLIDICLEEYFPVEYIVSLSAASFKVGRQFKNTDQYDLMISLDENADLDFFISQVKHYLDMINH